MNKLLLLLLLSVACAAAPVEEIGEGTRKDKNPENEDLLDKVTEDTSPYVAAPTLGSLVVVVLLGLLVYYCCCHKKTPEGGFTQLNNENDRGFTQLNNENDRNQSDNPNNRGGWRRWRNKRWRNRNRGRNYQPNPPDVPHSTTNVVIHPAIVIQPAGIPTGNLNAAGATTIPNMMSSAPPPPYDGGMHNQQFVHGNNFHQTRTNPPPQFTRY